MIYDEIWISLTEDIPWTELQNQFEQYDTRYLYELVDFGFIALQTFEVHAIWTQRGETSKLEFR